MLKLSVETLSAVQSQLQDLGWIEPDTRLTNPRPAGEGNMNRTLRVDCAGPNSKRASIILKQAVPFVAKYPDIPAPIERGAAEAAFYRATQQHSEVAARLPELLGCDATNHLLAFEDLGSAVDLSAAYATPAIAKQLPTFMPSLLSWLSQLHSMSPPAELTNMAMRELNYTHIFNLPLQTNNGLDLGELNGVADDFANDTALISAAQRLGDIYLGKKSYASTPALLHGDFYPGSWLADMNSKSPVVSVIDPEFTFVGPAEFDVGVCLAHLQFAGLSKEQASVCIASYRSSSKFDMALAEGFAGIELIRRLLGVAQLPLATNTSTATKTHWLNSGRRMVLTSSRLSP